jgi:hypothetical protein
LAKQEVQGQSWYELELKKRAGKELLFGLGGNCQWGNLAIGHWRRLFSV